MQAFVLFDDVPNQRAILLQNFCYQDILYANQLADLDVFLQHGWQQQLHCALFIDYEFGLTWQRLPERDGVSGCLKLYWFAEKQVLNHAATWLVQHAGSEPAGIATPQMNQTESTYHQHINQIHEAIRRGDTYQINYTVRLHTTTYGNPIRLYARLRQNVPYAALGCLPDGGWRLCFSPELFLKIQSDGKILTEPMKGTAPILGDDKDEQRAAELRSDPKNRAENTMIVDLLRNDLGKLAEIGGVSVPEPFKVQAFGKVWQMTSVVQAQVKRETSAAAIIQAAFPCGSITGAPKRKSMEIIQLLEDTPRGLYTGSLGFLQPEPDTMLGFSGCLNVVIRTLNLIPKNQQHNEFSATYGVGSGIVIDSQAADEYAECGWKARFLTELRPEVGLFETMRVETGNIAFINQHLDRMAQSAHQLNMPFDRTAAEQLIANALMSLDKNLIYRLKLNLESSGSLKTEIAPLTPLTTPQRVIISDHILPDHDPLRRHKTSHRAIFDRAWQAAEQVGAFDALLFNQSGYLLEGGRSSVMILHNHQWLTPPLDLDILPSVARQHAIHSGSLKTAHITRDMLLNAQAIRVGNALRGWLDVELI